ncbi:MAG: hypothetical protein ACLPKI_23405 [Streptosporangiaceae bacterium]
MAALLGRGSSTQASPQVTAGEPAYSVMVCKIRRLYREARPWVSNFGPKLDHLPRGWSASVVASSAVLT